MDQTSSSLRLAELLAALSVVIDIGMRRPPGEAARVCLVATSLARALGVDDAVVRDVFYTGLMQDLGCGPVIVDYVRADGEEPVDQSDEEFFRASCEVGALMADRLQLGLSVRQSLLHVFERWDGKGRPYGKSRDDIPVAIRVARVATHASLLARAGAGALVTDAIRRRSGRSLDPRVCDALLKSPSLLHANGADPWEGVLDAEPNPHIVIQRERIDDIAAAFGDRVDMIGRGYLRGHSSGVTALADAAGQ